MIKWILVVRMKNKREVNKKRDVLAHEDLSSKFYQQSVTNNQNRTIYDTMWGLIVFYLKSPDVVYTKIYGESVN